MRIGRQPTQVTAKKESDSISNELFMAGYYNSDPLDAVVTGTGCAIYFINTVLDGVPGNVMNFMRGEWKSRD